MTWHLGSRINVLDMVRFTEQASILASELTGRNLQGLTAQSMKHWLLPWFLGSLRQAYCNPKILHRDRGDESPYTANAWKTYGGGNAPFVRRQHDMLKTQGDDFDLDLVISVLDGASSLKEGRTSTGCVIAGGERDCFPKDPDEPAIGADERRAEARRRAGISDQYFVIVVGEAIASMAEKGIFGVATGPEQVLRSEPSRIEPPELLVSFLDRETPLGNLIKMVEARGRKPTIAVGREGFAPWEWQPKSPIRKVTLEGSTVEGALAALLRSGGVDIACMFCRRTHAIQVATACRALRGSGWFVPITGGAEVDPRIQDTAERRILRETDLVKKEHAFLIVTGVTGGRSLPGVECRDDNHIVTHTWCLSTFHRARRRITNNFDLDKVRFVNTEGVPQDSLDVIKTFRQEVEEAITEHVNSKFEVKVTKPRKPSKTSGKDDQAQ